MDFDPSRSKMYSPVSIDDELNQQILDVTTRFEPSPDIKNIMVTGGNGFMSVLFAFHLLRHLIIWVIPSSCGEG